ncbi:GNAT family N-acetyltransferase [Paractinoplanes atraurantiacus]|nr:GNAT family N-acetyltransferase [Actinoplanes atraurantiacus]
MDSDLWPPFGLRLSGERVELRLPREEELGRLARLAGEGVHRDGERPFLTPWTEGSAEDRERAVLRGHWGALASWRPEDWELGFGVFRGGEPIGLVGLRARDFAVVREVKTWSWLGLEHQGQGYGTEARSGLLTLAFDHLGAEAALTEVFQDNHASQRVSRKLGYVRDGISVDARDGEALVSDRLRLTREGWAGQVRPPFDVEGVPACRPMVGL